jgi:hypothetical protein
MRIVAKRKDYYDCIQATGQDRSLVYVREPQTVYFERNVFPFPSFGHRFSGPALGVTTYIVGFCGKIYPCLRIANQMCYSLEDVDNTVVPRLKKKELEKYHDKSGSTIRYELWVFSSALKRVHFEKFFEKCAEQKGAFGKFFEEKRCPVFVAVRSGENGWIEYNALLRSVEFYRVMEPYTAFQEVSMYMGNMAMPEKPIPQLDDVTLAESKGFDKKWSFRREPAGK